MSASPPPHVTRLALAEIEDLRQGCRDALVLPLTRIDGRATIGSAETVLSAAEVHELVGPLEDLTPLVHGPGTWVWPAPPGFWTRLLVLVDPEEQEGPARLREVVAAGVRAAASGADVVLGIRWESHSELLDLSVSALLGAYRYAGYRHRTDQPTAPATVMVVASGPADADEADVLAEAQGIAEAVYATCDLVNAMPAELSPEVLAERAVDAAGGLPVAVTVLDEHALREQGCGGLLGVGQGSTRPPRLVKLEYRPADAQQHLALVGKGITFDAGGLCLKPPGTLPTMKLDMAGAAAVLHAILAVARRGLPVRITGWMALAENLPSGSAQRPGDVVTVCDGTTIEVIDTDCEGRLVLADALILASREDPDVLVDVATLTGAQPRALGDRIAAVMGNDAQLCRDLHLIGEQVGEPNWPMPLPPYLRRTLDSPVADLANFGILNGSMLSAGLFLREFIGRRTSDGRMPRWAHLDIVGPSFNAGEPYGTAPRGGTGFGVRLLYGLASSMTDRPTSSSWRHLSTLLAPDGQRS